MTTCSNNMHLFCTCNFDSKFGRWWIFGLVLDYVGYPIQYHSCSKITGFAVMNMPRIKSNQKHETNWNETARQCLSGDLWIVWKLSIIIMRAIGWSSSQKKIKLNVCGALLWISVTSLYFSKRILWINDFFLFPNHNASTNPYVYSYLYFYINMLCVCVVFFIFFVLCESNVQIIIIVWIFSLRVTDCLFFSWCADGAYGKSNNSQPFASISKMTKAIWLHHKHIHICTIISAL